MSNDKLAEALRSLRLKFTSDNDVPVPEARITRAEWEALEQAHAAEAAQVQAQSVPGELAEPAAGALNYEQKTSFAEGWNACREAMLAAMAKESGR